MKKQGAGARGQGSVPLHELQQRRRYGATPGLFGFTPQWFIATPIFLNGWSHEVYPYSLECPLCGWGMAVGELSQGWHFECVSCGYYEIYQKAKNWGCLRFTPGILEEMARWSLFLEPLDNPSEAAVTEEELLWRQLQRRRAR